jgi:uncharacterized protein (DUF1810 family)
MGDPFDLTRFIQAQDAGGTYERAVTELRQGYKTSHWMWFVFPQIAGLGQSATSRRYALASASEARAYLAHPVLGARLRGCAQILVDTVTRTASEILGPVDSQKLHSSMTLFLWAQPGEPLFGRALERFFEGKPDEATERLLGRTDEME